MKILVVDDDIYVAKLLKTAINRWGHMAEISSNGKDALKTLNEMAFDAAFVDIILPDCMGDEIIPQIKQLSPNIKIIAMSGYDDQDLLATLKEQAVDQFMAKPFSLDALKANLDELFKEREGTMDAHH